MLVVALENQAFSATPGFGVLVEEREALVLGSLPALPVEPSCGLAVATK